MFASERDECVRGVMRHVAACDPTLGEAMPLDVGAGNNSVIEQRTKHYRHEKNKQRKQEL